MKTWRVSIYANQEVEAETLEDAEEMVNDMLIGCLIKTREFELDTEEIDGPPNEGITKSEYASKMGLTEEAVDNWKEPDA
jgi:hypothetical protein